MPDQRPETTRTQATNTVVIGAGYAGVMAANRLTRREDVTVTLINPRPAFVERSGCTSSSAARTTPPTTCARCSPSGCT